MAAFMNRLGALGTGKTPVVNARTSQSTDGFSLGCPANTVWSQGLCFEKTNHPAETVFDAAGTCAGISSFLGAGWRWRLPTVLELYVARGITGIDLDANGELTDSLFTLWNGSQNFTHTWTVKEAAVTSEVAVGAERKFRCVAPPIARDGVIPVLVAE
jgi:hypothetical protein